MRMPSDSTGKETKMRWLTDYIHSCFCKHDYQLIYHSTAYENDYDIRPLGDKYVYICKKCMKKKIIKTY